jgi:hypothetical protein
MHRLTVLLAFALLQGCVISIPAFGDRWLPGSTVELTVDGDDALVEATLLATEAWVAAGAPVTFKVSAGSVDHEAAYNGTPAVFYGERGDHKLGTAFGWSSEWEPALIAELDIVIDPGFAYFLDPQGLVGEESFDLEAVMLHEIGHGLGLDHLESLGATMEPDIEPATTSKRSLEQADIAALREHYAAQ